jgi:hypothetical protein
MSDQWIAILAVATSVAIGLIVLRVVRTRRHIRENLVPHNVREKSHEVANEATKVRASIHRIKRSKDPLTEFISVMTGHRR